MTAADEVRLASERFYAALNSVLLGDFSLMSAIWAHDEYVTGLHPFGGRDVGWEQVRSAFEGMSALGLRDHVELYDQLISVGEQLAYEVGFEEEAVDVDGDRVLIRARVTNIYRRDGGEWKIVHHHTDAPPSM